MEYTLSVGTRVAIKMYERYPRHWRYTQRQYRGKVATVMKVEHDPINNHHGYRLDIDNQFHRWFFKDFAAVNVRADFEQAAKQKAVREIVVEEVPKSCPKCSSNELDITTDLEIVSINEVHRVVFCEGCGANILLKYKFFTASCIPIK